MKCTDMDITAVYNRLKATYPDECFRLDSYYRMWERCCSRFTWETRSIAIEDRKAYVMTLLDRSIVSADESVMLLCYCCGWPFFTEEELEQLRTFFSTRLANPERHSQ